MAKCNTEDLYAQHRERLLSLIQSKVEDSQKAEDLLHDSFIKLQTCCDQNCECEKPKSYLFRLTLNTVYDYFKKKLKVKSSFEMELPSNLKTEEAALNAKENCDLYACIVNFLKETSQENRDAFTKVDIEQIPQVQVAEALNIPLPTLKSRVQRTRKFLKNKIEICCPDYANRCK